MFKAAQWLSSTVHLYHRPGMDVYVCLTFKSGDRCVADCWVAARLKSRRPASPALSLSLSQATISQDGEVGESCEWCTSRPESDEKDLPSPVKRGRYKARGYAHWNAISCTSLLHSRRCRGDRDEKCALWKMAPITCLTPADLCCWPPHLISVTSLQCLNPFTPPHTHTRERARTQTHTLILSPTGAFRLVMTIQLAANRTVVNIYCQSFSKSV